MNKHLEHDELRDIQAEGTAVVYGKADLSSAVHYVIHTLFVALSEIVSKTPYLS